MAKAHFRCNTFGRGTGTKPTAPAPFAYSTHPPHPHKSPSHTSRTTQKFVGNCQFSFATSSWRGGVESINMFATVGTFLGREKIKNKGGGGGVNRERRPSSATWSENVSPLCARLGCRLGGKTRTRSCQPLLGETTTLHTCRALLPSSYNSSRRPLPGH